MTQYRLLHTTRSKLQQIYFDSKESAGIESKQLRGQSPTISPIKPSKDDKTIRYQLRLLNKAKSSKQIIESLKFKMYTNSQNGYIDKSVYGKAIQLCSDMRDYKATKSIMDLMLRRIASQEQPVPDAVVFTIFFNAMAKIHKPMICYQYFLK